MFIPRRGKMSWQPKQIVLYCPVFDNNWFIDCSSLFPVKCPMHKMDNDAIFDIQVACSLYNRFSIFKAMVPVTCTIFAT